MTANRIKEVALVQFAQFGYDGASLAQIAEQVGIKKPSIYAHFKGKDELFLAVIQDVVNDEMVFIRHYFAGQKWESIEIEKLGVGLYQFLEEYVDRYEHDDKTKFFLRMPFFPPAHLYVQVMKLVYEYLDQFEELLTHIFAQVLPSKVLEQVEARQIALAFMGVLDAVVVELLYGGPERFAKRLQASWTLFWRGIS